MPTLFICGVNMGGITSSSSVSVGTGLSGNGTPASPLINTGVLSLPNTFNSVGSYSMGAPNGNSVTVGVGSTVASPLYANSNGSNDGGNLSGTWLVMSGTGPGGGRWFNGCNGRYPYLMLRIA